METLTVLQKTEQDIQKEINAMNDGSFIKSAENLTKNVFKTEAEADEFLNTSHAIEMKMVKWEVRKDCYMVNTPDRIEKEKEAHEKLQKMPEWQRNLSITLGITGMVMGIGMLAMRNTRKRKLLELKLKYVKKLQIHSSYTIPSEDIFSILDMLSVMSYKNAEIMTGTGWKDVSIQLFGLKSKMGIREKLDLFNVNIDVALMLNRKKVRHIQFALFDAKSKNKRPKRIKVVGKSGGKNYKTILNRLQRTIDRKPDNPSVSIRNLYSLTNMPDLRKVLPEVEEFLTKLYPKLFSDEDYMNWKARRIKKTLQDAILLKSTLTIPPKQPPAFGGDETERVMECLIGSLKKWHIKKTKNK